jgi:peptide deformylase
MAIRPILVAGNPVLHQKARRVTRIDRSIQTLIDDMIETMRAAPGVGLAAPQIGVPLRIAVIEVNGKVTTLINPEIVKGRGRHYPEEGCLSVPGFWARVPRYEEVTVKARDRYGHELRIKGTELFGQALQHEIDHLEGLLYVDRLEPGEQLRRTEPPRAQREAEERPAPHGEPGTPAEPAPSGSAP